MNLFYFSKKSRAARKEERDIKSQRDGYDYALGCLIRGEKTPMELECEAYRLYETMHPFDRGIIDAMSVVCGNGWVVDDRLAEQIPSTQVDMNESDPGMYSRTIDLSSFSEETRRAVFEHIDALLEAQVQAVTYEEDDTVSRSIAAAFAERFAGNATGTRHASAKRGPQKELPTDGVRMDSPRRIKLP